MAWHPGTMGGPAIIDVLFGETSPTGRLPVTWPKAVGQIPIYYNHNNTGRPPSEESFISMNDIQIGTWQTSLDNTSHYRDIGFKPQFPFGFGLGYTQFKYDNIRVSNNTISIGDSLYVSADIFNTGKRIGTEVVQLYVRDVAGDVIRPVKELKGFKHITLKPGEKQTVEFILYTDDLAYYNQNSKKVVTEPGEFRVWIGKNAEDGLEAEFEIRNP